MFPHIETIDDVLPYIEGHDDFFVAERPGYKVINYRSMLAFGDLWIENPANSKMGGLRTQYPPILNTTEWHRRECRGIKFYPNGDIVARPFHKFFNVNEKIENHVGNLPWGKPHRLMTKWDGSMIHVGIDEFNAPRLMTKMGVTGVAEQAEAEALTPEILKWLEDELMDGKTHLLEFISPNNKIVLNYSRPAFVWTGCRDTYSGEYIEITEFLEDLGRLGIIYEDSNYGTAKGGENLVGMVRGFQNEEGVVVAWSDGRRVKIKSDWYALLHKKKEILSSEADVLEFVLDEAIDDLLPILDAQDQERLKDVTARIEEFLDQGAEFVATMVMTGRNWDYTKKDFAVEIVNKHSAMHPIFKGVAFTTWETAALDESNPGKILVKFWARDNLVAACKRLTTSNAKAKTLESAVGPLAIDKQIGD